MLVLGVESSCDETAAAVVADGTDLLSNVIASQIDVHKKYGGVVPEIASRKHIEAILPVIAEWDVLDVTADHFDEPFLHFWQAKIQKAIALVISLYKPIRMFFVELSSGDNPFRFKPDNSIHTLTVGMIADRS